jgi:hypothetical protein
MNEALLVCCGALACADDARCKGQPCLGGLVQFVCSLVVWSLAPFRSTEKIQKKRREKSNKAKKEPASRRAAPLPSLFCDFYTEVVISLYHRDFAAKFISPQKMF